MNKWLIRTKSMHILGPISKEKVQELYKNGSLKADDELCCGNGYWFFVREKDHIDKYVLGNSIQPFNPICDAKDVCSVQSQVEQTKVVNLQSTDLKMPSAEDLEYPDFDDHK
jgi:hypothetical protein